MVKVRHLKRETLALYLAFGDPRVPWHARVLIGLVVGYAVSPIDLIPDFVPVLGYLDDLLLLPLGIALAVRMIPETVMDECRLKAVDAPGGARFLALTTALVILCTWASILILLGIRISGGNAG